MDNFPEDLREVVSDHWAQFPPQHPLIVDFFGILFFCLTITNLFANSLVIYVFLANKDLRTPVRIVWCTHLLTFEIGKPFKIHQFQVKI